MPLPRQRVTCLVLAVALAALAFARPAHAQLQLGAITGLVIAPDGQPADGATVTLQDPLGVILRTVTAARGTFSLPDVPPGTYTVRAALASLLATAEQVTVTSALPVKVELRLSAVASEQVQVYGAESGSGSTTTRVTLGGESIRRAPARVRSRGVQAAIAGAPGWSTEDNGLLHVRGVDDGFLYVIDGVPVYERLDGLFGMAPDPAMVESLTVITGYIPPEFGWKAGGILEVRSASRPAERWAGSLDFSTAADATSEASGVSGGPLTRRGSLTVGVSGLRSSRYLDPVHPDNLHNTGGSWNGGGQSSWSLPDSSVLTLVGGVGRSRFDVPHGEEQDAAGQDQRQRLRQDWQSASWQRAWSNATISQLAAYRRGGSSGLNGSDADTPLFTDAGRTLRRAGVLASVSHQRGRHLIKAGGEASWLRLRETFMFAVTDPEFAEDADLSEEAIAYTIEHPFRFTGAARPTLFSLYLQDSIRLSHALTIEAGVRADWSRLLVRSSQLSPRAGVAYRLSEATIVRGSAGRFFQPPQPENVLLASSGQAWSLSPFRSETGGGAELSPERQTVVDLGVDHTFSRRLRLDVSVWRRWLRDVADPNVFFGTTILFPNAVAKGRASGIDVRLEVPRRRGWSGYLSYANARVVQFGPISGGLFLEDEVIEIGPGTSFTPDHDQRNVGALGVSFDDDGRGWWMSATARYESGTPLETDEEEFDELAGRPGAELVDFDRGRVKPRTVVDVAVSKRLLRRDTADLSLRVALLNATGRRWAYNFGNPFSGTHFGPGRSLQLGVRVAFD